MATWNPIDTAPKDGRPFVALGLDYGIGPRLHSSNAIWDKKRKVFSELGNASSTLLHLTHWTEIDANTATVDTTLHCLLSSQKLWKTAAISDQKKRVRREKMLAEMQRKAG